MGRLRNVTQRGVRIRTGPTTCGLRSSNTRREISRTFMLHSSIFREKTMYATRRGFNTAASFITLAALCLSFLLSTSAAAAQGRSDFDLRQLGGGSVTLAQSQGRITVLAFGASWLPLSRGQVQGLKQLADDYG